MSVSAPQVKTRTKTIVAVSLLLAGLGVAAAGFVVVGKTTKTQVERQKTESSAPRGAASLAGNRGVALVGCGTASFPTDYIVTPIPMGPNQYALPSQAIAAAQSGGDLDGNGTIEVCLHGGNSSSAPNVYNETATVSLDMAPWTVGAGTGIEPVRIFADTPGDRARWNNATARVLQVLNTNLNTGNRVLTVESIGFYGSQGAIVASTSDAKSLVLSSDVFAGHTDTPAVWLAGWTLATIESSTFTSNASNIGPSSLLLGGNANVVLVSNQFLKNYALEGAAIVAVDDVTLSDQASQYVGNIAHGLTGGLGGGAIFLADRAAYAATNAFFYGNEAQAGPFGGGEGGGLASWDLSSVSCLSCVWKENQAGPGGGAVVVYALGGGNFTDNIFLDNKASSGGAVRMGDSNTLTFTGGRFESNSATGGDGGAIYGLTNVTSIGSLNVTGTHFLQNDAQNVGGAIGTAGGTLTVNQAIFDQNSAAAAGAIIKSATGTATISTSVFADNSATMASGGAVWLGGAGGQQVTANISNSTFDQNNAKNEGGAVYGQDDAMLTLNGNSYQFNTAQMAGGAVSMNGSNSFLAVQNSPFSQNQVMAGTGRGGAVSCYAGTQGMTLQIVDSQFASNTAPYYGGAVSSQGCDVQADGNTFTSNTSQNAGALSMISTPSGFPFNTILTGSAFVGNSTSTGNGGAVYLYDGNHTFQNLTFEGNTAQNQGGGLYVLSAGNIFVSDSSFTNNNALDGAGGMFVWETNTVNLEDIDAFNNTASYGGGFLSINNTGSLVGSHLDVRNNQVTTNGGGGGVYLYDVDATISNSIFAGNSVPAATVNLSSAIYAAGGGDLFLHYVTMAANEGGGVGAVSGVPGPLATDAIISAYNDVTQVSSGAATTMHRTLLHTNPPANPLQNAQPAFGAGVGNLTGDPLFVGDTAGNTDPTATADMLTFDFHLQPTSPAVDADATGALDPDGSVADIGAYGGPSGAW